MAEILDMMTRTARLQIADVNFRRALQRVLERRVDDHESAARIWLEVLDTPEYGALLEPFNPVYFCSASPTEQDSEGKKK